MLKYYPQCVCYYEIQVICDFFLSFILIFLAYEKFTTQMNAIGVFNGIWIFAWILMKIDDWNHLICQKFVVALTYYSNSHLIVNL